MKQKEIFDLACKVGYTRFNPHWEENMTLGEDTWLLELTLLQRWLREEGRIELWVEYACIDSDTYEYVYEIRYFPIGLQNNKRECERIKIVSSFDGFGGTYSGAWKGYLEAFEEGIFKALKIEQKEMSLSDTKAI
jgi:hypothetical protein